MKPKQQKEPMEKRWYEGPNSRVEDGMLNIEKNL